MSEPMPDLNRDPMLGLLVLGRYRVIAPLAHGGMGVVYLGRTEGAAGFSRPVVIKRVIPQLLADPSMAKMFVREARILSNLDHPGIVGVVDFGEERGAYVMVLDYVHGYDASVWLTFLRRHERMVPVDVALQISIRVLEALHYAHTLKRADGTSTQVIHRDVSPGNVLLDVDGRVRLLDFGIARIATDVNEYKTQDTTFKGKLGYAHPSLVTHGEPTTQTDIYSASVVLFQLLTGINPFRGANAAETLSNVVAMPLPLLRKHLPSASPTLEAVIAKGMSRDLKSGFESAQAMAELLMKLRSVPEAKLNAEMARMFTADFAGALPEELGLEPLERRDAAWRKAVSERPMGALRSTPPPSPHSSDPTRIDRSHSPDVPTAGAAPAPPTTTAIHAPPATKSSNRALLLALGGLALAVAAVAVALFQRPSADPSKRYLVITQDSSGAVAAPGVAPSTNTLALNAAPSNSADVPRQPGAAMSVGADPNTPELTKKAPATAPKEAQDSSPRKPEPQMLTQRFAQHQGRVQSCFSGNPEQAAKTPDVQIAFTVDASGAPTSVNLIPAGVSSTPLGQCLTRIAHGARFGALTESVSFRIPVQARLK